MLASAGSPAPQKNVQATEPNADLFGEWLHANAILDENSFRRAKHAAAATHERFDQVLTKLGLLQDSKLLDALARFHHMNGFCASDTPSAPILPDLIPVDFIQNRLILPIASDESSLTVAVVDPFDFEAGQSLEYLTGLVVVRCLISLADFQNAVQNLYGGTAGGQSRPEPASVDVSETDVARLRDIANDAPVIRLVNDIIQAAADARASDIHIEPGVAAVAVRLRINGDLRTVQTLNPGLRAAVTSRIKIMAKLDIAERRLPQDGRIRVPVRGTDIEFRVSTLPVAHGESVEMRVLDQTRVELDFETLGYDQRQTEALKALLRAPNGIILVTGPTGSGKTTTLYTGLKFLNEDKVKIITVEDPVEYEISGLSQVQVHPQIGLTFPQVLRSILRQNPNIVMIGEIRDAETARIAIETSLTGHLVLSTLHTNSAAASITRLLHMGIEDYLIASTVNGVLAQRLVRRLCPHCATPHPLADHWKDRIGQELGTPRNVLRILQPAGCDNCSDSGFVGRIAIAELMVVTDEQRRLVLSGASDRELEASARNSGMVPLLTDGLLKAGAGLATIEDVLRVTQVSA